MFPIFFLAGCISPLFYHPVSRTYQTPKDQGLEYEEVRFESGDGIQLTGWFVPAVGEPLGTVIHFHGNAQNMSAHFSYVDWLPREGLNLLVFDYRGYGHSAGRPSRRGVYDDAVAAMEYLLARPGIDPEKIVVFGQSLGGANAVAVMGRESFASVRAVIVESAFYSYRKIVRDRIQGMGALSYLKWPLSLVLIGNAKSPGPVVHRIAPIPLVVMHGTEDPVIPFHHGEMLFDKAWEPKEFWVVQGGGHTEAFFRDEGAFRARFLSYVKGVVGEPGD